MVLEYSRRWNIVEALRYLSLISQVGFTMVTPVLLCTFIGIKLEERFHFPFTLIFLLLGVISGCMSGYRLIMNSIKKMEKDKVKREIQIQKNSFVLPKKESRIFNKKDESGHKKNMSVYGHGGFTL